MEISTETTIKAVTVYPDRARIEAVAAVDVTSGTHRLLFDQLPLSLESESVRVSGAGAAAVRLLGVEVGRHFYEMTPAQNVRELENEIERVEDQQRSLQDQQAGWQAQLNYLDGLRQAAVQFARGLARGQMTVGEQDSLLEFMRRQDEAARNARRQLAVELRELEQRLQKLRRELEALQAARPRQRYQVRVDVEVTGPGRFEPRLTYVVRQAGWKPLYDIRFAGGEGGGPPRLEVDYLAQIAQKTGEAWQGVQLTLSTARPALNQRLPELKPWYIDEYVPPVIRARSAMAEARGDLARPSVTLAAAAPTGAAVEGAPEPVEAETAVASVRDEGMAVRFDVPGTPDIPGDGSPHKLTIRRLSLDPQLDYLTAPGHTDAVYRRAKTTNMGVAPLLAGPASLFVDDVFIGSNQLDYTPVGGELELLLGVEERIEVERELSRRDVDKRVLRDNRHLRYGYQVTLKNLLPETAEIELHDQIPVSRHEQIRVKLGEASPAPDEQSDLNLMKWCLRLDPGAEQIVRYDYSVEHPRSLKVAGLVD